MNSSLSNKQTIIMNALCSGLRYKEIAATSNISINTVKKHLKNSYRKLNVNKKKEAVMKFAAMTSADIVL